MKQRYCAYGLWIAALSCAFTACSNDDGGDDDEDTGKTADVQKQAIIDTKAYVTGEVQKLVTAAKAIQKAAPAPDKDGWNAKDDAKALANMRAAWNDARDAYEHVEGSIAILFRGLDVATDERYDAFLEDEPDENLFDGEGVTGMHAIERILWAGDHPANVVAFEKALDGYKEAAFPATEQEADEFKNELAQKLIDDTNDMLTQFKPKALDAATAYWGVIGSMTEQLEKVTLAATAEDESRYAQRTLDDMRANLEGGEKIYAAFKDWVVADSGKDTDEEIEAGFEKISKAYADIQGVAIPSVPEDFDTEEPSEADLATPYGKLYQLLTAETDVKADDSLIRVMRGAADDMELDEVE
jgi:iron uptake system component EfeO